MGPERGISIPVSERKPFNKPEENKIGSVGVLDKPEVAEETSSISSTYERLASPKEISIDMGLGSKAIRTIKDTNITVLKIQDQKVQSEDVEEIFNPSNTALHEAGHSLVGVVRNVGIDGADIIPKGNALGVTYPDQFDAPTAAAGYATGTGGEGHDEFVTEVVYGQNFSKAAATATVILRNNQEALMRLGRALDINKSLSRQDIYSIVAGEEDEDQNGAKETMYEVIVKGKNGEEREVIVLPEDQTIIDVSLPQSGDIFVANEKELSLTR